MMLSAVATSDHGVVSSTRDATTAESVAIGSSITEYKNANDTCSSE